eukprot:m.79303 g.79303  ORF g.79303 m.79303 type:complete len:555 (+) comp12564_c0_seq2:134-1798(+)
MSDKVVVWATRSEWLQVYDDAFSGDVLRVQAACTVMQGWQLRGRVPLGVESTLALLRACLHDTDEVKPHVVRTKYSLAIIRFINGFSDANQTRFMARAMNQTTAELQIPEYIVDLRHEATHKALPSLQLLRVACLDSLKWLRTKYWVEQYDCMSDALNQVRDSLNEYRTVQHQRFRVKQRLSPTTSQGMRTTDAQRIRLKEQQGQLESHTQALCRLVLEDLSVEYALELLVHEGIIFQTNQGIVTPQKFKHCLSLWNSLLSHLGDTHGTLENTLVLTLLDCAGHCHDQIKLSWVCAWLNHLFQQAPRNSPYLQHWLKRFLQTKIVAHQLQPLTTLLKKLGNAPTLPKHVQTLLTGCSSVLACAHATLSVTSPEKLQTHLHSGEKQQGQETPSKRAKNQSGQAAVSDDKRALDESQTTFTKLQQATLSSIQALAASTAWVPSELIDDEDQGQKQGQGQSRCFKMSSAIYDVPDLPSRYAIGFCVCSCEELGTTVGMCGGLGMYERTAGFAVLSKLLAFCISCFDEVRHGFYRHTCTQTRQVSCMLHINTHHASHV